MARARFGASLLPAPLVTRTRCWQWRLVAGAGNRLFVTHPPPVGAGAAVQTHLFSRIITLRSILLWSVSHPPPLPPCAFPDPPRTHSDEPTHSDGSELNLVLETPSNADLGNLCTGYKGRGFYKNEYSYIFIHTYDTRVVLLTPSDGVLLLLAISPSRVCGVDIPQDRCGGRRAERPRVSNTCSTRACPLLVFPFRGYVCDEEV